MPLPKKSNVVLETKIDDFTFIFFAFFSCPTDFKKNSSVNLAISSVWPNEVSDYNNNSVVMNACTERDLLTLT